MIFHCFNLFAVESRGVSFYLGSTQRNAARLRGRIPLSCRVRTLRACARESARSCAACSAPRQCAPRSATAHPLRSPFSALLGSALCAAQPPPQPLSVMAKKKTAAQKVAAAAAAAANGGAATANATGSAQTSAAAAASSSGAPAAAAQPNDAASSSSSADAETRATSRRATMPAAAGGVGGAAVGDETLFADDAAADAAAAEEEAQPQVVFLLIEAPSGKSVKVRYTHTHARLSPCLFIASPAGSATSPPKASNPTPDIPARTASARPPPLPILRPSAHATSPSSRPPRPPTLSCPPRTLLHHAIHGDRLVAEMNRLPRESSRRSHAECWTLSGLRAAVVNRVCPVPRWKQRRTTRCWTSDNSCWTGQQTTHGARRHARTTAHRSV